MAERDWIHVNTRDGWSVYGLMDPYLENHVFYVGITQGGIKDRVNQHRSNRDSAAWGVIKDIEAHGGKVGHCEFAQCCTEGAARHLESALITALPQIVNRTHEYEGRGFWTPYPDIRFE